MKETEQNYYKNLTTEYRKTLGKVFDKYNKIKKYYDIGLIIAIVSVVINLILLGKCYELNRKNINLTKELAETFNENIYLKGQNEELWETYYSGIAQNNYYK